MKIVKYLFKNGKVLTYDQLVKYATVAIGVVFMIFALTSIFSLSTAVGLLLASKGFWAKFWVVPLLVLGFFTGISAISAYTNFPEILYGVIEKYLEDKGAVEIEEEEE